MSESKKHPNFLKHILLSSIKRQDRNPVSIDFTVEDGNKVNYVIYIGLPPKSFFKNNQRYYKNSHSSVGEMINDRANNLELRSEFVLTLTENLDSHGYQLNSIETEYPKGVDRLMNTSCEDFYKNLEDWYNLIRGISIFSSKMKDSVEEIIFTSNTDLLEIGKPKCNYCDHDTIKLSITHFLKNERSLEYLGEINNDFDNLIMTPDMQVRYMESEIPVNEEIDKIRSWFPNHYIVLDFDVTNMPINMACKMSNSPLEEKLEFIRLAMKQVL